MMTDAEAVGEQGIMIPNSRSSGRADSTVERIYYSIEVSRNQRGPKQIDGDIMKRNGTNEMNQIPEDVPLLLSNTFT
jgi:hypothetical protein